MIEFMDERPAVGPATRTILHQGHRVRAEQFVENYVPPLIGLCYCDAGSQPGNGSKFPIRPHVHESDTKVAFLRPGDWIIPNPNTGIHFLRIPDSEVPQHDAPRDRFQAIGRTSYRPLVQTTNAIFESPLADVNIPSRLPEMLRTIADYIEARQLEDGQLQCIQASMHTVEGLGTRWKAMLFYEASEGVDAS